MTEAPPARILNARIASTMLGIEDHGMMTFVIFVEWNRGSCGLGTYGLDEWVGHGKPRVGDGHSYQAIRHILETLCIDRWEKLPGTLIRIHDPGLGRSLDIIGHIIEDRWFDLREYMKTETECEVEL